MGTKYIETPTGKVMPATDSMIEMRDNLCKALGFQLETTPKGRTYWTGRLGVCTRTLDQWRDMPSGGMFYQYPEQVTRAAHAVDKSKAPKATT